MNDLSSKLKRDRKGERGSILAMSALGMLSLLLAVGLGVDISHFYLVKSELQNAADASALAAASAINSKPAGIIEGTSRAVQAMNQYDFNNKGIAFTREHVTWAVNLDGPYMSEEQAATEAQAPTIRFAKVSGGNGGDIQAEYIEDRLAIGEGGYDPTAAAGDPVLAEPVLYR